MTLETSKDVQELEAILESLCDEAAALRAKDTGGEQGITNSSEFSSTVEIDLGIREGEGHQ